MATCMTIMNLQVHECSNDCPAGSSALLLCFCSLLTHSRSWVFSSRRRDADVLHLSAQVTLPGILVLQLQETPLLVS